MKSMMSPLSRIWQHYVFSAMQTAIREGGEQLLPKWLADYLH